MDELLARKVASACTDGESEIRQQIDGGGGDWGGHVAFNEESDQRTIVQ